MFINYLHKMSNEACLRWRNIDWFSTEGKWFIGPWVTCLLKLRTYLELLTQPSLSDKPALRDVRPAVTEAPRLIARPISVLFAVVNGASRRQTSPTSPALERRRRETTSSCWQTRKKKLVLFEENVRKRSEKSEQIKSDWTRGRKARA